MSIRPGAARKTPDALGRMFFTDQDDENNEKDYTLSGSDAAQADADIAASVLLAAREQTIQDQAIVIRGLNETLATVRAATAAADGAFKAVEDQVAELIASNAAGSAEIERLTTIITRSGVPMTDPTPRARMSAPHGFVDDESGFVRSWSQGQVITDTAEIEMLKARGAPIEDF